MRLGSPVKGAVHVKRSIFTFTGWAVKAYDSSDSQISTAFWQQCSQSQVCQTWQVFVCVCVRIFVLLLSVTESSEMLIEAGCWNTITWLHRRYNETFQYKNWVSKSIFAPSNKIIGIASGSLGLLQLALISSHFKSACYKSMKTVLYCKPQRTVDSSNLRMTETRQGWQ